jgi:tetratricopeptide (TPR) repeat protein
LKDDAGFVKVLTELTKRFPSKDYWSDLLNTLGRLPNFNQRYQLDVSRLMAATEVLEDADDYTDMAVFAMKSGLPVEALRVLDKGHAAGVFAQGTAATNYAKLKQQALARAAEDDKAMKGITLASNDATQLVQLADVLLSKGQASAAVEAYQKALGKGGLRREAEVRLHLGIALLQSQQKEAAKAQLNAVAGDEALVTLAGLWASLAR